MNLELIKLKVSIGEYVVSQHADRARQDDNLTVAQLKMAINNGRILEQYPDNGRGESCLIVGFSGVIPIHIVCGIRGDKILIVTVYIPDMPKFTDPFTRAKKAGVP